MEHWYEYGVTWDMAFSEINRVLKVGGKFMANAPVYYHGHPYFMFNNMVKIENKMKPYFTEININQYYNKEEKRWQCLSNSGILCNRGIPNFMFPKDAFSRQSFIYATKSISIHTDTYRDKFRYIKVCLRFLRELIFS